MKYFVLACALAAPLMIRAAPLCSTLGGGTSTDSGPIAFSALGSAGCQIGGELFSNFSGNPIAGSSARFLQSGSVYTFQVEGNLNTPFGLVYTVDVLGPGSFTSVAASLTAIAGNPVLEKASPDFSPIRATAAGGGSSTIANLTHITVMDAFNPSPGGAASKIDNIFTQASARVVPEPETMMLLGAGLLAISLIGKKRITSRPR